MRPEMGLPGNGHILFAAALRSALAAAVQDLQFAALPGKDPFGITCGVVVHNTRCPPEPLLPETS